jgi:hypothetical protein
MSATCSSSSAGPQRFLVASATRSSSEAPAIGSPRA